MMLTMIIMTTMIMEKNDDDDSDDEDHLEHTAGCGGGEVAAVTKPEDAVLPAAHSLRHNTQYAKLTYSDIERFDQTDNSKSF